MKSPGYHLVLRIRRRWTLALVVCLLLLIAGAVTVRAVWHPASEDGILQPTDPGITTRIVEGGRP